MTPLHLLKLGLVCTILILPGNLVSGNTECPLTDEDFLRGRDIDVSLQKSDGRDFHEHGNANYQGDIELTPEQYEVIVEGKPKGRALNLIGHWPGDGSVVNIPYIITACDLTDAEKANIARAIEEYKNKTCIRFIPRTNEEDYINIFRDSGCWSRLGKTFGEQPLSLEGAEPGVHLGCAATVGTPIHELMHAIGYMHEQARKDRDQYVTINWENMNSSDAQTVYQFEKCEHCDLQNSPYDYNSVMHYGAGAFSNNGQPTITTLNGESIGQRKGFSDLDIKGINDLYCGGCEGEGCWMNTGCCNEVEVTGLTRDAASREGTYVKQNGTFKDRTYYKLKDSNMYNAMYIHWDGRRWIIDVDVDTATFATQYQQTLNLQNNPGCESVAGNQCPTVCGGTWKEWIAGWTIASSISVKCKVNTAHCNNTVKDSDETEVDCGGVSCDACENAVNGGWGTWSSWTKCNAKCPKANGKQVRTRECDNPKPENGGENCVGREKEEKNCKITCSVDGGWGKWSQWSKCNAKCPKTKGKQVRTRKCNKPAPEDGGKKCIGKNKAERSCKIKCSSTSCKETCKKKNKKCSTCKKNKCKSKGVQKRCPVTCNKCKSGGSGGNKPCKDKAGAKKCKKDKKKCKKNKKVQKKCAKTCKKCK